MKAGGKDALAEASSRPRHSAFPNQSVPRMGPKWLCSWNARSVPRREIDMTSLPRSTIYWNCTPPPPPLIVTNAPHLVPLYALRPEPLLPAKRKPIVQMPLDIAMQRLGTDFRVDLVGHRGSAGSLTKDQRPSGVRRCRKQF